MRITELIERLSELPLHDRLENRLHRLQKQMFQEQTLMCEEGTDSDQLPNGYGEFGLSLSNPIPCRSILGSRVYLERLRTLEGIKVYCQRIGSYHSDVTRYPVDGYAVSHTNGTALATLYVSAYQKRNSERPPLNFRLAGNPFN